MVGGKLSRQLTTSKRKWLTELRESDASVGAWNADATESDRPMGDMAEVFNMRKMRPGELEVRSGFQQYAVPDFTPTHHNPNPLIPLAKCQYRLDEIFVDVTIYWQIDDRTNAGNVWCAILHPERQTDPPDPQLFQLYRLCPSGAKPVACCVQYGTYLVVSIVADDLTDVNPSDGDFVFALSPTSDKDSNGVFTLNTFTITPVGKQVCPMPNVINFSPMITGKLLCFVPLGHGNNTGVEFDSIVDVDKDVWLTPGYKTQLNSITGATEFEIAPLDIKAPYYLTTDVGFGGTGKERWRHNKKDPVAGDVGGTGHLKTRGWLYRFVFKRKFFDVRHTEIIVTSAPSSDVYAEDRIYTPPYDSANSHLGRRIFPLAVSQENSDNGGLLPPRVDIDSVSDGYDQDPSGEDGGHGLSNGIAAPSVAGYTTLREKLKAILPTSGITDYNDNLFFLAASVGLAGQFPDTIVFFRPQDGLIQNGHVPETEGYPPYKLDPTSYEITKAPNTLFGWGDFSSLSGTNGSSAGTVNFLGSGFTPEMVGHQIVIMGVSYAIVSWIDAGQIVVDRAVPAGTGLLYYVSELPLDAYAIDVYRTAYCYPDPKDSDTAGTGYAPYSYGYVGTIAKPDPSAPDAGMFMDNVQDGDRLLEESPLDSEGYLEGQFAGEVTAVYQDQLVFGNTRTKAWLRTPWSAMQAFGFFNSTTGYDQQDLFPSGYGSVAPDGLPWYRWYYAYSDTDKKLSNAVPITLNPSPVGGRDPLDAIRWQIAFLFPRGYSSAIDSVLLIQSRWINPTESTTGSVTGNTLTDPNANFTADVVGKTLTINNHGTITTLTVTAFTTTSLTFTGTYSGGAYTLYFLNGYGARHYYKEAFVGVADGTYVSAALTLPGMGEFSPDINSDGTLALRAVTTSNDPGYVIWSKVNQLWAWPQTNIENETDQDPITGLGDVIGPLYVLADKQIVMTRLDGYREPVSTGVAGKGCISRYGYVKVNRVMFYMSSYGLMFAEGSGIVEFPANIQTEITKRLREKIGNLPSLSGVRNRVSMSYLAKRQELWVTFPSTIGLGGVFPTRTFVLKLFDKGATSSLHANWSQPAVFACELEIAQLWPASVPNWEHTSSPNPVDLVIHLAHADGTMFSAFHILDQTLTDAGHPANTMYHGKLIVQDNDRPEYEWPGHWAFQYQHAAGSPSTIKQIFTLRMEAAIRSQFFLKTGMLRQDGGYDRDNGTIDPSTGKHELVTLFNGERTLYALPISGDVNETSGAPVAFRISGNPTPDFFENKFTIDAFDLYFGYVHQHKGD